MSASSSGRDPWLDCPAHLNARLIRPLLRFYERRFGGAALEELAGRLGTSLDVLEDPDRWFSAELILSLNRAMISATGDPDITYKAGRALAEPGIMGPERMLVRALLSPRRVLESLASLTVRYSRITLWRIQIIGRGAARVDFQPLEGATDDLCFCRNRIGVLEAVPLIFDLPAARVEHTDCVHTGGSRCVYDVSWVARPAWDRVAWVVGGAAAGIAAFLLATGTPAAPVGIGVGGIALGLCLLLMGSARRVAREGMALTARQVNELRDLVERNERRVGEMQAMERVTDAIRHLGDEETVIDEVLGLLRSAFGYERAMALRLEPGGKSLGRPRAVGFDTVSVPEDTLDELDVRARTEDREGQLFGQVLTDWQPMLVDDIDDHADGLVEDHRKFLESVGARAFVVAPVEGRGARQGVLYVDRHTEGSVLTLRDRDLIASVAAALGSAIANARLFDRVREELLVNQKFRQYLAPQVVDSVRGDPAAALRLGGSRQDVAVMLCDIAGFTAMSAKADPEQVVRGLNAWFAVTDPLIEARGGIVDKRMGDGILIVHLHNGRAEPGEHPVARAVRAAVSMQEVLARHWTGLSDEARAPVFAEMQVRHAIHYGSVIAGNLGSESRMEHTIIGDAVNVCARLEGITPAGAIWLTGEAVEAVGISSLPEGTRQVASERLRGRDVETQAWAVPIPS